MKIHNLIFFFLMSVVSSAVYGQKNVQKSINASAVDGIFIDSDQIFEIRVKTGSSSVILLESEIEGETFETVTLNTSIKEGLLVIETGRTAVYQHVDDKLAAHKVLSVVLNVVLPEGKQLWIDSSLASVEAEGQYDFINLNLSHGNCRLLDFRGSGIVNTQRGFIYVETKNCSIDASSRNGTVDVQNVPMGKNHLSLASIDGSVAVVQSK